MKTYSGELKDGITVAHGGSFFDVVQYKEGFMDIPRHVLIDNEWQRYEPNPKKVWGIPECGQKFYAIVQEGDGKHYSNLELLHHNATVKSSVYLDKHTAEQHAKALNYINELRALSDVPVDGVVQWYIMSHGGISCWDSENA